MLNPYKTILVDEIKNPDNIFKAFFLDYDANVIFNFVENVRATTIQLRPFWLDLDCWYPGDGAGSKVYYSTDKSNWTFLSVLPSDYGYEMGMVHEIKFEEKEMRYLKFETKEYALSICFIKVF